MTLEIRQHPFGRLPDGRDVSKFELCNEQGMRVHVLNYGGVIQSIVVPDSAGTLQDVILGYDTLDGYLTDLNYLGALVGRYANRIAEAAFILDGIRHDLSQNEAGSCLHGGPRGFNQALWRSEIIEVDSQAVLRLEHTSPHADQGFPGQLKLTAEYCLNEASELHIHLSATCDRKTVINLTMHPYFNLSGDQRRSIGDHELQLNADRFLPVNPSLIPTGELKSAGGSPFDLSRGRLLAEILENTEEQLNLAGGLDHFFVCQTAAPFLKELAVLKHPASGRVLRLASKAVGLQVYTANHLPSSVSGKQGLPFVPRTAVCLEPQAFPNAPNQANFPSTVLEPGGRYDHILVYAFSSKG